MDSFVRSLPVAPFTPKQMSRILNVVPETFNLPSDAVRETVLANQTARHGRGWKPLAERGTGLTGPWPALVAVRVARSRPVNELDPIRLPRFQRLRKLLTPTRGAGLCSPPESDHPSI
jgi:hypothetical protein